MNPKNPKAEPRADFIKRLFAVAISVGFATTLSKMEWVERGSWPEFHECEQLIILVTGLILAVASWDGYLVSIAAKPLNGNWRFWIDIILVFIYMIFLITSRQSYLWLPILVVVFILYFVWDILTVREHLKEYDSSLGPSVQSNDYEARCSEIALVYWRGLLNKSGTKRGPIITVSWASYFAMLALLNHFATVRYQVFVGATFAILGLIHYRKDKETKTGDLNVTGYSMVRRLIWIVTLLGCAALYFYRFGVPVVS